MSTTTHDIDAIPDADELRRYRLEAREWLAENMPPLDPRADPNEQPKEHLKDLARRLYSGGYSGICFPEEVGGAGLTRSHHQAFCEEAAGYELPIFLGNPGLSIIAPPIMEFGTDRQKEHVAAMLRGERLFVQMMSEPTGGSDMAGALTRADRDGDVWVLNGSKIWSSGAWRADWGLILVRTDWTVPKHQGLSLFLLDLSLPGITINNIKMVDGTEEFCEEFFDDAIIPAANVVGEVDDGWTVATRLLFHERSAVGGSSPYTQGRYRNTGDAGRARTKSIVENAGRIGDPIAQQLVGQTEVLDLVQKALIDRVRTGISSGHFPGPAGSLVRLFGGMAEVERTSIALELAGQSALVWDADDPRGEGVEYIRRQASCLGGGSTEMARNLISERVLDMPREHAADRGVAFRDVKRNAR